MYSTISKSERAVLNRVSNDEDVNLLVREEAGTETVSPVLRAYGLRCVTHGTKVRSKSEEE